MEIELGDLVQDKITGFKGVVVCKSSYITGCDRVSVQPQELNKDGKPYDWQSFDVTAVNVLAKGVVKFGQEPAVPAPTEKPDKKGGPQPEPEQLR